LPTPIGRALDDFAEAPIIFPGFVSRING